MHAQPLQIPDDSADDSDPADNAHDAANDNDMTSATVQTAESVAASPDTSDCCEVCLLQNVKNLAGAVRAFSILRQLHPWTVVARYAVHPFAWCCACLVH